MGLNADQSAGKSGQWNVFGAVLSAVAASACCVLPPVLLALGVGGAWASRLEFLEAYRPLFIALTLMLLGLGFYRAYRPARAESCSAHGSCRIPAPGRVSRAALWIVSPLILALLAAPLVARHLPGHILSCGGAPGGASRAASGACCVAPAGPSTAAASTPQKESTALSAPVDPAREIVFDIQNLQCPAVKGVGCGSMLAPVLARIDRVEGVSRGFCNWTGTRLRVSAAPGSDRNNVAERVQALLAKDGHEPVRAEGKEFAEALQSEDWHSADRLVDLSSFEFQTIAKRRIGAFADAEGLDPGRRERLLGLADQLWDRSAEGLDRPGSGPDAYGQYWRARLDRFVGAYMERARDVLSPDQLEKLGSVYRQRR